jgi:predicted aconitase
MPRKNGERCRRDSYLWSAQYGLASQAGYVEELEKFGAQFLQDTFTQTIMTNSGKYIHYGPCLG